MTVNDACNVLGVCSNASPDEIRAMWKKRAFEFHPDRGNGTADQFRAAQNAYAVLTSLADETPAAAPTRPVNRPNPPSQPEFVEIRPGVRRFKSGNALRVLPIEPATHAECLKSLGNVAGGLVVNRIEQRGRQVTFVVEGTPEMAAKVALPTGFLVDPRNVAPVVLDVAFEEIEGGVFTVSEPVLTRDFPGAHGVQVRFEGQTV